MTSGNARAGGIGGGGGGGGDVKIAVVATRTIVGMAANSGASDPSAQPRHGCQVAIARFLGVLPFRLLDDGSATLHCKI